MPRDVPSFPSPLGLSEDREDLDPELLALPGPSRRARTVTVAVLGLAGLLALGMAFELRRDIAYAFAGDPAVALGELRATAPDALASADNRFVRAEAMVGAAGGIRYERPFGEDTFRTMPVAGRADVWVDVRVPVGQESGRWEPPRSFAGRLVRFDAAGPRHRGVAAAIEQTTGERLPSGAWLLIDGEEPAHARRSVVLVAILLGFALWNAAAIGRILRKVR